MDDLNLRIARLERENKDLVTLMQTLVGTLKELDHKFRNESCVLRGRIEELRNCLASERLGRGLGEA